MRLGINLLYLIPGKVGGTETYARELIKELSEQIGASDKLILYCSRETAATFTETSNIKVVCLPFYATNRLARLFIEQTLLPVRCMIDKLDVILSLGYSAPLLHPCPSVVTIHDLNWYYHPEDFGLGSRVIWNILTRASALFSNHIITDSQASSDSLTSILKVSRSKVTAILHGVPTPLKTIPAKSSPYLFTAVAGYPHKNLSTLIKVFGVVSEKFPTLRLKVCGLGGKADHANSKLIKSLNLSKKVDILGYVSRQELANLYANADVFVFPSAYEGFGYPVLEAMSYGAPVVSSNAYSLKEVVGKGGILVNPYDVSSYIEAIISLLSSESKRRKLISLGAKRASQLKWEGTTNKTLKLIRKILEKV